MARTRTIRPDFFKDEKVSLLPHGAMYLLTGLWCQADLRGVFVASPEALRKALFSEREMATRRDVIEWLERLEEDGHIGLFQAGTVRYGWVKNWIGLQPISANEIAAESSRPAPPGWIDPPGWARIREMMSRRGKLREWRLLRRLILERDSFTCGYCGSRATPLHVDHIIPIARGGTNDPANLIAACAACNGSKSDKPLSEWKK